MTDTDPLKTFDSASPSAPPQISEKSYPIAGILTTVFGLDELPPQTTDVACLWLLHPRLATKDRMTGIAQSVIADWNRRIAGSQQPAKGLIAVSFDQRNHGTRLVDTQGNESWKKGNPRHAQDMFSVFREWCDSPTLGKVGANMDDRGYGAGYLGANGLPPIIRLP